VLGHDLRRQSTQPLVTWFCRFRAVPLGNALGGRGT
jgi:hypothetical protein